VREWERLEPPENRGWIGARRSPNRKRWVQLGRMRRLMRLVKALCARGRGRPPRKGNRRNQLKHMLSGHTSPARLDSLHVHHPVYPGFLRNDLIPRSFRDSLGVIRAPSVPYTSHIISGNDLDEPAGPDVSDLDESTVEKEDVGWVPGNPFCYPFPLDRICATAWVSMLVNVQSELCGNFSSFRPQAPRRQRTIIAEQELVLVRPEHPHGPTQLAPLRKLPQPRVFLWGDSDTPEAAGASVKASHSTKKGD